MAQQVKNLLVMQEAQETQVRSLGLEDPLEEEIASHSSILAWRIPWTEEPGRLQSWQARVKMTEKLTFSLNEYLKHCEIPLHNQQNV